MRAPIAVVAERWWTACKGGAPVSTRLQWVRAVPAGCRRRPERRAVLARRFPRLVGAGAAFSDVLVSKTGRGAVPSTAPARPASRLSRRSRVQSFFGRRCGRRRRTLHLRTERRLVESGGRAAHKVSRWGSGPTRPCAHRDAAEAPQAPRLARETIGAGRRCLPSGVGVRAARGLPG